MFGNTCIESTKDTGWLNRQERWQEMDVQAMQEWKMSNGEESPFLSKSSAILIPPPPLKLGTKLGGFFPLITVSNVNQGARDGATARDGFLLLIGRRSAQFLSGSCLHCPRNTVPLVATPMKRPAERTLTMTFTRFWVAGQGRVAAAPRLS